MTPDCKYNLWQFIKSHTNTFPMRGNINEIFHHLAKFPNFICTSSFLKITDEKNIFSPSFYLLCL